MESSLRSPLKEQVAQDITSSYQTSNTVPQDTAGASLDDLPPITPSNQHEELLWLARCIYSETKRPIEQLYVGWVIRNRVESQYRGYESYRDVVLDPYQFSAFNAANYGRDYYISLAADTDHPVWQQTLEIARYIMHAPASNRPFSLLTRHFYSERSLTSSAPQWSQQVHPTRMTEHEIDRTRFRFFTGVL